MSQPGATITSVTNQRVKDAAALERKKERDATGRYLVEGPNAVDEAIAEGVAVTVFVTEAYRATLEGRADVEVVTVADHVLERIATSRTPQGVVAVARQRAADLESVTGRGLLIVCHEVSDPGNAGAIIRTADAVGASGVVLTAGSVDPFNPKAVRASTGSITRVPVVTDVPLPAAVAGCRAARQRVLGLATGATASIDDAGMLEPPVALVFGSEAHGLSEELLGSLDDVVSIPLYGRAESLNLAAAVAVAAYAAARVIHAPSTEAS